MTIAEFQRHCLRSLQDGNSFRACPLHKQGDHNGEAVGQGRRASLSCARRGDVRCHYLEQCQTQTTFDYAGVLTAESIADAVLPVLKISWPPPYAIQIEPSYIPPLVSTTHYAFVMCEPKGRSY